MRSDDIARSREKKRSIAAVTNVYILTKTTDDARAFFFFLEGANFRFGCCSLLGESGFFSGHQSPYGKHLNLLWTCWGVLLPYVVNHVHRVVVSLSHSREYYLLCIRIYYDLLYISLTCQIVSICLCVEVVGKRDTYMLILEERLLCKKAMSLWLRSRSRPLGGIIVTLASTIVIVRCRNPSEDLIRVGHIEYKENLGSKGESRYSSSLSPTKNFSECTIQSNTMFSWSLPCFPNQLKRNTSLCVSPHLYLFFLALFSRIFGKHDGVAQYDSLSARSTARDLLGCT